MRSRWSVIGRDILVSSRDARWGLGIGALLFIAAAMACRTSLGPSADMRTIPTLSDYVMFAFAGSYPSINSAGAPFTLPVIWFALIFFCIHSCALFPYRMMRGIWVSRSLQAGSRLNWWGRLTF